MTQRRSFLLILSILLVPAGSARAQGSPDLPGHWEGAVQTPNMDINIAVDIARNSKGELIGTLNGPNLKGLPLRVVTLDGKSVTFDVRRDQPFTGTLSADGASLTGDFTISGQTLPFGLTRKGDAVIEPPATSPRIGKELEGTWNAAIEVEGKALRLVLTMMNNADGTASGAIVNLDQGELRAPLTITQTDVNVTLALKAIGGSFAGVVNADGSELSGTYTQGPLNAPVTFRRAATEAKK
jgi:hypothetical protein